MAKSKTKKRKRNRKGRFGNCAICNRPRRLTQNHVPPKGSYNTGPVVIHSIAGNEDGSREKGRLSQNGLWFESICDQCNGDRLGRNYDIALNEFSNNAKRYTRSVLSLPGVGRISCRPQRVARAVIGHILSTVPSHEVGRAVEEYPLGNAMREYFLNPGSALPNLLNVHVWSFPYPKIAILRAFSTIGGPTGGVAGSILKFFPLAFWVTHGKPPPYPFVTNLLPDRELGMTTESEILVHFGDAPHEGFPEAPLDDDVHAASMFASSHSLYAVPRKKKGNLIAR